VIGAYRFLAALAHQLPPAEDQAGRQPVPASNIAYHMPGCIVSATTANFNSLGKRRRRATPVITSTFENMSDIGVSLGLCLGPQAIVRVRLKRGALRSAITLSLALIGVNLPNDGKYYIDRLGSFDFQERGRLIRRQPRRAS